MNGREYFHESVVRDIVDVLTSLKDYDEVQFINNSNANRSFKSITSATKDLILTFPVIVSSDIEPDNAIMIAKAHEKKMASLLHIPHSRQPLPQLSCQYQCRHSEPQSDCRSQ